MQRNIQTTDHDATRVWRTMLDRELARAQRRADAAAAAAENARENLRAARIARDKHIAQHS